MSAGARRNKGRFMKLGKICPAKPLSPPHILLGAGKNCACFMRSLVHAAREQAKIVPSAYGPCRIQHRCRKFVARRRGRSDVSPKQPHQWLGGLPGLPDCRDVTQLSAANRANRKVSFVFFFCLCADVSFGPEECTKVNVLQASGWGSLTLTPVQPFKCSQVRFLPLLIYCATKLRMKGLKMREIEVVPDKAATDGDISCWHVTARARTNYCAVCFVFEPE